MNAFVMLPKQHFWYVLSQPLLVPARHVNYCNRRVPNGTHGGVRGRRLITTSYLIRKGEYRETGSRQGCLRHSRISQPPSALGGCKDTT